jgi:hypothetical protein
MTNILNFKGFINESKYSETGDKNIVSRKLGRIQSRIKADNPEVELTGYEGGKDWFDAMAEKPGQALQRLVAGASSGIVGLGRGFANLFGKSELDKYDAKTLKGKKREVLQKWGEDIKKTGRNEEKDYEVFYKKSLENGRKTFGKDFDIENPRSEDEEVYADYVNSASKYYKIK